jgi:hypothetical protein
MRLVSFGCWDNPVHDAWPCGWQETNRRTTRPVHQHFPLSRNKIALLCSLLTCCWYSRKLYQKHHWKSQIPLNTYLINQLVLFAKIGTSNIDIPILNLHIYHGKRVVMWQSIAQLPEMPWLTSQSQWRKVNINGIQPATTTHHLFQFQLHLGPRQGCSSWSLSEVEQSKELL